MSNCRPYRPIDYRLRCHTKRTDLPADVLRDIGAAAAKIERLRKELNTHILMCNMRSEKIDELTNERDEARREILESLHPDLRESYAAARGWDCFKEESHEP